MSDSGYEWPSERSPERKPKEHLQLECPECGLKFTFHTQEQVNMLQAHLKDHAAAEQQIKTLKKHNKLMHRVAWLLAVEVDATANPNHPCPNSDDCCDPGYIVEGAIRKAEKEDGSVLYGERSYQEEVAAMRDEKWQDLQQQIKTLRDALEAHETADRHSTAANWERAHKLRREALATPAQNLCEDEGCPHHGTPHVCLDKQVQSKRVIVAKVDTSLPFDAIEYPPVKEGQHND